MLKDILTQYESTGKVHIPFLSDAYESHVYTQDNKFYAYLYHHTGPTRTTLVSLVDDLFDLQVHMRAFLGTILWNCILAGKVHVHEKRPDHGFIRSLRRLHSLDVDALEALYEDEHFGITSAECEYINSLNILRYPCQVNNILCLHNTDMIPNGDTYLRLFCITSSNMNILLNTSEYFLAHRVHVHPKYTRNVTFYSRFLQDLNGDYKDMDALTHRIIDVAVNSDDLLYVHLISDLGKATKYTGG